MSNIPAQYRWVTEIKNPPRMMAEALKLIGIREHPGKANNNPIIMQMAKDLGVASIYPNDETPWCALVHSWICLKAAKPLPGKGYDLLRAKSFEKWGVNQPIPMFADTLVFNRPGGFHVGLYVAEDETTYHVAGGNQGNSYSFTRIEKKRLTACRRLYAIGAPASVKPYRVAPTGAISTNEA